MHISPQLTIKQQLTVWYLFQIPQASQEVEMAPAEPGATISDTERKSAEAAEAVAVN